MRKHGPRRCWNEQMWASSNDGGAIWANRATSDSKQPCNKESFMTSSSGHQQNTRFLDERTKLLVFDENFVEQQAWWRQIISAFGIRQIILQLEWVMSIRSKVLHMSLETWQKVPKRHWHTNKNTPHLVPDVPRADILPNAPWTTWPSVSEASKWMYLNGGTNRRTWLSMQRWFSTDRVSGYGVLSNAYALMAFNCQYGMNRCIGACQCHKDRTIPMTQKHWKINRTTCTKSSEVLTEARPTTWMSLPCTIRMPETINQLKLWNSFFYDTPVSFGMSQQSNSIERHDISNA